MVGVLQGPDGEIVGIAKEDNKLVCPGPHSCTNKFNQHDETAYKWASMPQHVKTPADARAARQERIAARKQALRDRKIMKAREAVGNSHDDLRAEAKGDWMHFASNPKKTKTISVKHGKKTLRVQLIKAKR
jgi:hypothetical protein